MISGKSSHYEGMNRTTRDPLIQATMTMFRDNILAASAVRARADDDDVSSAYLAGTAHLSQASWLRRGVEAFILTWALDPSTSTSTLEYVFRDLSDRSGLAKTECEQTWRDVVSSYTIQGWLTPGAALKLTLEG